MWQPIETAPRDGTPVDLWAHLGDGKGYRYPSACWDILYPILKDGPEQYGWTDTNHHGSIEEYGPFTHWMPLPEAPK